MSTLKVDSIVDGGGSGAPTAPNGLTVGTTAIPTSGALSNRNLIINGAMQVAQRGTSSTGVNYQTVDRFRFDQNTMDELAFTQSQDTDAPAGFKNSYKLTVNTPETSLVLTEWLYMRYTMEGQDAQVLQFGQSTAQKTTMSFWVKSSVTGDYAVLFFNDQGSARGQTLTYTVNAANTWEYKTIVFDGDTTQNFANSNAQGPDIYFTLSAGPDRTITDGTSWINYTANASSYGQTADVATVNGATWQITGVQLEVGDTATPFEHRSYGDELLRCQRYYEVLAAGDTSGTGHLLGNFTQYNSTLAIGVVPFKVPKRAAPTGVVQGGSSFRVFSNGTNQTSSAMVVDGDTTKTKARIDITVNGTSGYALWVRGQSSTCLLAVDAEL